MTGLELLDAGSAAEAVALLQAPGPGAAQPIAAGADLLGLLKEGVEGPSLPRPSRLVNLASVAELRILAQDDDTWRLGAMLTLTGLAAVPGLPPLLYEALRHIASPPLRNRSSLGGNLLQRPRCWYFRDPALLCFKKGGSACLAAGGPAEAHPGALWPGLCLAGHPSDLAPALIALDAQAELLGPQGPRRLPLLALYAGAADDPLAEAALLPAEVLTGLSFPSARVRLPQAFVKIAPRDANEFATAAAAVLLHPDAGGRCIEQARLVLGGVAPGPWWAGEAAARLVGVPLVSPQAVGMAEAQAKTLAAAVADDVVRAAPLARRHRARAAACRTAIARALEAALGQA